MSWGILYWLGLCLMAGAIIYALLCRETGDDPLSDRADGDWPALPTDLKCSSFHDRKE